MFPSRDGRDFIHALRRAVLPARATTRSSTPPGRTSTTWTARRALAISALCLAAARKQPRGVFTVTTPRYDDGRRQLRMSLRDLFREAVGTLNAASSRGRAARSCGEVFDLDPTACRRLPDPPYAPPRDDTCYIKRYHFLEGLATYWRGQEIMWGTRSRKLVKRHTPFASKKTVRDALDRTFEHFRDASVVVSYGSNAALGVEELESLIRRHTPAVERIEIPHTTRSARTGLPAAWGDGVRPRRFGTESRRRSRRHTARGHWLEQAAPLMTGPRRRPPPTSAPTSSSSAAATRGCGRPGTCARREPEARVVLLEADLCGHGPSGRNGGFCNGSGSSRRRTCASAGARGRRWRRRGDAGGRRGDRATSARRRASTPGSATAATCRSRPPQPHDDVGLGLTAAAAASSAWAIGSSTSRPRQVADTATRPPSAAASSPPDAATVQPARLALGLRRRLIARGVESHEPSPVLRAARRPRTASSARPRRHASGAAPRCWRWAAPRGCPLRGRLSSDRLILHRPHRAGAGRARGDRLDRGRVHHRRPLAAPLLPHDPRRRGSPSAGPAAGSRSAPASRPRRARPRGRRPSPPSTCALLPGARGPAITHAWGGPIDVSPTHLPR